MPVTEFSPHLSATFHMCKCEMSYEPMTAYFSYGCMCWVTKIELRMLEQIHSRITQSILWLMMPWFLVVLGLQESWYGLWKMNMSWSSSKAHFNNLQNFSLDSFYIYTWSEIARSQENWVITLAVDALALCIAIYQQLIDQGPVLL